MELCTNLQNKVLDLENTKTTQANEIASLKRRVKKIEKKRSSRTHKLKRLYKGRRINGIDADEDINLINDDADKEVFDVYTLNGKEVFVIGQNENVDKGLSRDKGKGILVDPEKPLKKKDQLKLDEEIALKLQAKIDEEERITRAEEEKIDEANIAWDEI
ncbi:hypothetical protein Tco_1090771 [Tanacetum coccineum]|uniref:Uncharacterized protein n=1 Tax=Tanacetum coccineum TaxID=301880 RepID=A0ABQ5I562_9ASTR